MRISKALTVAALIASLGLIPGLIPACPGVGLPALRISELLTQSDVVLVADVGNIEPVNRATISSGGVVVSGQRYRAKVSTLCTLVGSSPDQFDVEFVLPDASMGFRSVRTGTRMLFLKKSGTTYNPTSPYYPDFPAVHSEPAELHSMEGVELVFSELAAVIASPYSSDNDKWEALRQSFAIPASDKSFLNGLLDGLGNTADLNVRRRIQADLISRNDISQLRDVCNALLNGTLSPDQRDTLIFSIGRDLKNEKAVPQLTGLLKSRDPKIRIAAAQALWHINSGTSIGPLTEALNDANPEVRYYAIRGLADVTGDLQWGPSIAEYEQNEAKYRQHWLEWASDNSIQHRN